jgi:hypothetical protein
MCNESACCHDILVFQVVRCRNDMDNEQTSTDTILNDINDQFQNLIDLINKQRTPTGLNKFNKFEQFLHQRTPSLFIRKKSTIVACFVLLLSIGFGYIQTNDDTLYDVYFLFLSFVRMFIIKVDNAARRYRVFYK